MVRADKTNRIQQHDTVSAPVLGQQERHVARIPMVMGGIEGVSRALRRTPYGRGAEAAAIGIRSNR